MTLANMDAADRGLDAARLWTRVEDLSRMTLPDVPWTRRAFGELFGQSREWLAAQMRDAGLSVNTDAAGNLVGRREGRRPQARPLVTGSHCDTVVGGGRYDGIIGVLSGIEIAMALQEQGVELEHPFEVIDFLSEEPSDYGISCVGSRGITGVLTDDMLSAKNAAGETLARGMQRIGANPAGLSAALRRKGDIAAFVELHIEQGPVLESQGLPIGVVTNIVGIRRVLIHVDGQPDHAGTTPMDLRRDALVGAAALITQAHAHASRLSGNPHYVVATIGRLSLTPNVPNAVPGRVEMMLEMRSDHAPVLDVFAEEVLAACRSQLTALRLSATLTPVSRAEPTDCAPAVMVAAEKAAAMLGYPCRRLPSGAGHDAAYMAACGPMGMVFIPCLNGRSHCPEESISTQQLLDGTRVLMRTLMLLDQETP